MNFVGPHAAQQLLLHAARRVVDDALQSTAHLVSGALRDELETELADERLLRQRGRWASSLLLGMIYSTLESSTARVRWKGKCNYN